MFKNKMKCSYARNPFTNKQVKASTSEDVVQHVSERQRSLSGTAGRLYMHFICKLWHTSLHVSLAIRM